MNRVPWIKKRSLHMSQAYYACKSYFSWGGWIDWNIVSDVYIFTKGKSTNAERNQNVQLNHSRVFCGRLCVLANSYNQKYTVLVPRIPVRTNCRMLGADRIQNVDCRLQKGYKMQTDNLKCFFRLVCDDMSSYDLPSVTQSLFRDQLSPLFALL